MESIDQIQDQIVEEFSVFDDWADKYEYIIDIGKNLPALDDAYKTDANKITGCQSQVWLIGEMKDGNLYFSADSDAIITKGVIALLIRVLSGHTPDEILDTDLSFLEKIGMKEHLSPTRANGLVSMIAHMKNYAKLNQAIS